MISPSYMEPAFQQTDQCRARFSKVSESLLVFKDVFDITKCKIIAKFDDSKIWHSKRHEKSRGLRETGRWT